MLRARFGARAASVALFLILAGFVQPSGPARASPPGAQDLAAILDEASFERIGGCWIPAERKLLEVLSRTRAGVVDDNRSRALVELATLWMDRGDLAMGDALSREAIEAAQSETARVEALMCLMSTMARARRQDREVTEVLDEMVRFSERRPDDLRLRARTLRWQASVAVLRKKDQDALSLIRIADALLVRTDPFSIERGALLASLVTVLKNLADPLAIGIGERCRSMLESLAPEGLQLTQCLNNLAIARAETGDLEGALTDFQRALDTRERLDPGGRQSALALQNISSLFRLMGNLGDAEAAARRALAASPGDQDRIFSLHRLALVLYEMGQPFLQTEVLCQRDDLIDRVSLSGSASNARSVLRSWDGALTAELGTHLFKLGLPDAALTAIERARARAFLFARQATRLRMHQGAPRRDEQARLRGLYEAAKSRLSKLDAATQRRQADEARAEMFQLGMRLEGSEVVELNRGVPRVRSAAEIANELEEGTLALSYQRSEPGASVLWVRRGQPVQGAELALPWRDLEAKIRRFLRLATRSTELLPSTAFIEESRDLACILLGPVAHLVAGAKRLVISGDELVSGVPFPALVVDGTAGQPTFLAERLPVSHSSSFTALFESRLQDAAPRDGDLWCIGDPARGSGEPLPGARAEALQVASLHPGPTRVLLGSAAQETLIKSIPPSAGTLHFACHASSNRENPEDSALLLASPLKDAPDNGELRAWEIANEMSLNADLVVLSACSSSSAADTDVEGPLGLTRAFLVAGARRVLAARWLVPDAVAGRFMEAFYSARARGVAADLAVQEAQVALLSNPETAHPYAWAGFVLHGDGR